MKQQPDWKFREEALKLQKDPKFRPTVPLSRLLPYLDIPMEYNFKCAYCGKDFKSNKPYRKYCSLDCNFLGTRMLAKMNYNKKKDKLKKRRAKLSRKYGCLK